MQSARSLNCKLLSLIKGSDPELDIIISSLFDELACPICQELMIYPCTMLCGHNVCYFCLKEWFNSRGSPGNHACPTCLRDSKFKPVINVNLRNLGLNLLDICRKKISLSKAMFEKFIEEQELQYNEDLSKDRLFKMSRKRSNRQSREIFDDDDDDDDVVVGYSLVYDSSDDDDNSDDVDGTADWNQEIGFSESSDGASNDNLEPANESDSDQNSYSDEADDSIDDVNNENYEDNITDQDNNNRVDENNDNENMFRSRGQSV